MKVLILHQHFNTPERGGPLRSYYLAKALVDKGISVSIITARKQAIYTNENVEGIDVHYLPIAYDNRFGFYKRGISFIRYAVDCVRIAGRLKNIDLVYAMSVPLTVGQAAMWIKKKLKVPFIFEVGDLWPDAPIELGFIQSPVLKKALYYMEKKIYRQSKTVVALSPSIKSAIEKKVPGKHVHMIPNISDTDFFRPEQKEPALLKQFNAENKFVVSYIGAVAFANGLDYFLECARAALKAQLPVQFIICGDGGSFDSLKNTAHRLQLHNLTFMPFTNREGVRQIMNITDATFISYRPFPILETGSPNKYFDGLSAGKLIIINFKGWIKEEIEREKCGIAIDPNAPYNFVSQLEPFLHDDVLQKQYRNNARELAERKYSRVRLSSEFVSVIQN